MYTWGYLADAALAKLDLTQEEALEMKLVNRFPFYANEVITQVCSAIKPKRTFFEVNVYEKAVIVDDGVKVDDLYIVEGGTVSTDGKILDTNGKVLYYPIGKLINMPTDFISFGDDVCTITYNDLYNMTLIEECHDDVLEYKGYNCIICKSKGLYHVSYNARWYTFSPTISEEVDLSHIPRDILDSIPSYIASQCYKIDDEYKSSVYRNEYEMFLARIDDTNFKNTKTFNIEGDW